MRVPGLSPSVVNRFDKEYLTTHCTMMDAISVRGRPGTCASSVTLSSHSQHQEPSGCMTGRQGGWGTLRVGAGSHHRAGTSVGVASQVEIVYRQFMLMTKEGPTMSDRVFCEWFPEAQWDKLDCVLIP